MLFPRSLYYNKSVKGKITLNGFLRNFRLMLFCRVLLTLVTYCRDCVFTIDPKTARDLDDALSVSQSADGNYTVGVHIAGR